MQFYYIFTAVTVAAVIFTCIRDSRISVDRPPINWAGIFVQTEKMIVNVIITKNSFLYFFCLHLPAFLVVVVGRYCSRNQTDNNSQPKARWYEDRRRGEEEQEEKSTRNPENGMFFVTRTVTQNNLPPIKPHHFCHRRCQ